MFHLEKYCSSQAHIEQLAGYKSWRRRHGLQTPFHTLQIAGWFLLAFFTASTFTVQIPALGPAIRPPIVFMLGSLFCVHIISHVVALSIDPADYELRVRERAGIKARPEFDRARHLHVIENGVCHLCNIRASGPQTKHCRLCNKCVEHFDHHCKWLNQCVGARNYVAFLVCVVSAVLGLLTVLSVSVSEVMMYFVEPTWLDSLLHTKLFTQTLSNANYMVSQLPVPRQVFLGVLITQILLSVVAASFLLHLCFFHVYISVVGLTTYEYIRKSRLGPQPKLLTASNNASLQNIASGSTPTSTSSMPYPFKALPYAGGSTTSSQDKLAFDSRNDASDLNLLARKATPSHWCWCERNVLTSRAKNAHSEPELNGIHRLPVMASHHRSADDIEYRCEKSRLKEGESVCKYCQEKKLLARSYELRKSKAAAGLFSGCCREAKSTPRKLSCRRNQITPTGEKALNGRGKIFMTPRRASSLNSLPALPPPARRQIQSVSLKELNEILAYAQRPQSVNSGLRRGGGGGGGVHPMNSLRRQLRRKSNPQLKPTKTPNLSPIHESGLSNPSTPHLKDRAASRPKEGLWVSPLTLKSAY